MDSQAPEGASKSPSYRGSPQKIAISMARGLRRTLSSSPFGAKTAAPNQYPGSLEQPATLAPPTVTSPLSFKITPASSSDKSPPNAKPSSTRSSPRVFLDVLSQASKKITRTASRSWTSSSSSSQASSRQESPTILEAHSQHVQEVVSEYLELKDRHTYGFIDVSQKQRGHLGMGPKRVAKCEVYYEMYGNGPRRLFMVMGMMGCTQYWRLQTQYFAERGDYTICVFDNRGSGRSTVAPGPYQITQLARDAARVLDHVGWHDNIHMVGISLGGMIAQELLLMEEHPQFASVILVDTWHSATLAVPTVKEVRFAFAGMAALGDDPRHLLDLVFSRSWIHSPFRCSRPNAPIVSNRDVMSELFRAIRVELTNRPELLGEEPDSPQASPVEELKPPSRSSQHSSPGPEPTLLHTRTDPANLVLSTNQVPTKRQVSGDIHQFMACLGHRLSSQRVRQIRSLNPQTRFMVIHGEKDRVIRPLCGRALAKLLECPIVWIRHSGHMPPIDAHCTFNLLVRAFTRNEQWLNDLPDRSALTPASWDEQLSVRRWIAEACPGDIDLKLDSNDASARLSCSPESLDTNEQREGARRKSRVGSIRPVGSLSRDLFFVDENTDSVPGRIIPASNVDTATDSEFPTPSSTFSSSSAFKSPLSGQKRTRELLIYGALLDAPLRIRRYPVSVS
ncbi:hypothetical protein IWW42_005328 [Coemansia sp. RSA 1085]|nr:hypothetical protein IWW42_005328 [Coemansia sp. RSA 1085]